MFLAALAVPHGGAKCTYKTLSNKINSSSTLRWSAFVISIRKIGTPLRATWSTEMTWNCLARSLFESFALPQKISTQTASDRGVGTAAGICHFLWHVCMECLPPHLIHSWHPLTQRVCPSFSCVPFEQPCGRL